jgi:nickel-dependent lactate racemase
MPDLHVPWLDRDTIHLPETWKVQQVARPSIRPAGEDWRDRIAVSLSQPDSGPPLSRLLSARPGARVVLLVEDATRHSPLPDILDILLRELTHARVSEDRVEVFFCTGMHPAMSDEQARQKLGHWADRLRWRSNPWSDETRYRRLGRVGRMDVYIDRAVADADLRIVVSSVSPHLQAGFGGGAKMFLPGAASLETIRSLHRLGIGRRFRQLVGTDASTNPMRSAIDAGAELIDRAHGVTFALQYVLDTDDKPAVIGAGRLLPTQQMLAKQCSVSYGVAVDEPADIVIANAAPRDYDLWQSFKAIANTLWAVRRHGVIVCLSACPHGREGMDVPRWPLSPAATRRVVQTLGPTALASMLTRFVPSLSGDAAFFVRLALQVLHRNPIVLVSPPLAEAGGFPGLPIYAELADGIEAAGRLLGDGPQRVVGFPAGGVTYPVPTVRGRSAGT